MPLAIFESEPDRSRAWRPESSSARAARDQSSVPQEEGFPPRISDSLTQECDSRCRIGQTVESPDVLPIQASDWCVGRFGGRGRPDGKKTLLANGLEVDLSIDQADQPEINSFFRADTQIFGDAEMRQCKHSDGAKMRHRQFP